RTCPNRLAMVPYNPNNALIPYQQNNALIPYQQNNALIPFTPQTSIMNKWKVPWMSDMVMIRKRPTKGKLCQHCGAMGHRNRNCPIRAANVAVRNLNNIKKSVKKYFDNPTLNIRSCYCCGEIGHNRRSCPINRANRGYCIFREHRKTIKKGINEFRKYYGINRKLFVNIPYQQQYMNIPQQSFIFYNQNIPKIPKIPRRLRIPNYIAACGCCGNENHNRYDPQCPFQNGLIQPCLNPRLIKSIRELRLWYVENNRPIPPNIGIGLQPPRPNQPPP
ncbi:4991_t:CDS:2, partial [Cetraspora pellucida]